MEYNQCKKSFSGSNVKRTQWKQWHNSSVGRALDWNSRGVRSNLTGVVCSIFTARKRSLGQGNIFSSVCQEFCPQGGGSTSVHTGIPPEQTPVDQAPPPSQCMLGDTVNKRAVCILLECSFKYHLGKFLMLLSASTLRIAEKFVECYG